MAETQRAYLAFDLEISKSFPDGVADWRPYRPFGISCAATQSAGESLHWYGKNADGKPADKMSRAEAVQLVEYLQNETASGKTIVTWNGAGFDFDILAEESGLTKACQELALKHVDMMFHFFCKQGYMLGLDKAAKGMGLVGKTAGFSGALAPQYWQSGRRQEVLDYVAQDASTTLSLCQLAEQRGALAWTSSTGKSQSMSLKSGWLTVKDALDLPLPDTAWMKQPIKRSKFTGWLSQQPV